MLLSAAIQANSTPRRSRLFRQESVLREALAQLRGPGDIAVFDLDSTLLDNRPRQARIVREYGEAVGDARLAACLAEYWEDWNFDTPMARCGLATAELAQHRDALKAFWRERFFTSAYCQDDVAIAGASSFLRAVTATGATICYVTGRHQGMGLGSLESFRRAGFPMPGDHASIHLLLKPRVELDDDAWKVEVRARLQALGQVRCAFDNEPTHINSYRTGFDGCYAVHLDTDHSGRPVDVLQDIPSVRDFLF